MKTLVGAITLHLSWHLAKDIVSLSFSMKTAIFLLGTISVITNSIGPIPYIVGTTITKTTKSHFITNIGTSALAISWGSFPSVSSSLKFWSKFMVMLKPNKNSIRSIVLILGVLAIIYCYFTYSQP